jgi:hypothetical protein
MLPKVLKLLARLICLAAALFTFAGNGAEAPAVSWATFLGGGREGVLASKVLANPAGGFYLYSTGDRPLIKFNGDGSIAWEVRHEIGVNDVREVVQADVLENGDVIAIVGADGNPRVFGELFAGGGRWLVRLRGSDATPVFVRPIENCEVTAVHALAGGGYLVGGFTVGMGRIGLDRLPVATNAVFVAQFSTTIHWIRSGEWSRVGDSVRAIRTGGSGAGFRIWAGGYATEPWSFEGKGLGEGGAYALQLDASGNVVEGRTISTDEFVGMELRPSGGANVVTRRDVVRLNADTSVVWRKEFLGTGEITGVTAGDEMHIVGWNVGASFVAGLDSSGNQKWRRDEFSRSVNIATGAGLLSDGRVVVSGSVQPHGMFLDEFFLRDFSMISAVSFGGYVALFDVRQTAPPVFREQPRDQKLALRGETVELRANVFSPTPLAFQWYKDGVKLAGQTATNLVLPNITAGAAGKYFLEANNGGGTTRSREVEIVVNTVTVSAVAGTEANGAFEQPRGVTALPDGSILVADSAKHVIKRVNGGTVSTFAGSVAGTLDGAPGEAQFSSPGGLALEVRQEAAYVYVADRGNSLLRQIRFSTSTGEAISVGRVIGQFSGVSAISTAEGMEPIILGAESSGAVWEVTDVGARILPVTGGFSGAGGVALDERRNVFVSDVQRAEIRRMTPSGEIKTIANQLSQPRGMALDDSGNVYVVESGRHGITKISPSGIKTTVAGRGFAGLQNGGIAEALFNAPDGICFRNGALIVADTGNRSLRQIQFVPVSGSGPQIEISVTGSLAISVSGVAGATFAVESSDSVSSGAQWRVEGNVAVNAGEKLTLPKPTATRFYRARRLP